MDEDLFDVAVVGGGPAGSVAAYVGAQRGMRVALIDRQTFPRNKTCGDGIGPGAVDVAQQLGLGDIFEGERPIDSVTVFGPDESRLDGSIPDIDGRKIQGFVIPRLEFDERLFRHAIKQGACDLTGWRFTGSDVSRGLRTVALRDGSHNVRHISARLLIGADGAHSAVRKALGVLPSPTKQTGIAIRAYCDSDAFEPGGVVGPRLLFEFSRDLLPSYGWIFPTGKGIVNIGIGGPLQDLQDKNVNLKDTANRFADSMRSRGIDLGELHSQRAAHLPQFAGMPHLNYDRAALVGDAASMINPVSGEGIAYAMAGALSLMRELPGNLAGGDELAAALQRYDSDFRAKYRLHIASSIAAHRLLRAPLWAKMVVRAAQRDPAVLRDAIELLFGFGRIHSLTTARILRYGW